MILIFGISLLYSKINDFYKYKIHLLGIPVANCTISYSDTTLIDIGCKKIEYKVKTNSFIDKIFKIDNYYTVIVDTTEFNTMYYSKKTYQPNVENNIYTIMTDDSLMYNNSEILIHKKDKNIFTILYLFQSNHLNRLKNIDYIEREGKYYNLNVNQYKHNQFKLAIEEIDVNKFGAIKDTDIFLWGFFLDGSNNKIILNNNKYIEKCTFKKGLNLITAKYVE
tara:strand:+ start:2911 stop:3576 length:666 start_codon:yes stop_codon:yes gene_type:complete